MFYGLDVHKLFIQGATIKDAASPVKKSFKFDTTIEEITKFAKTLKKNDQVVLESTTHAFPVARLLRQFGATVFVSNPTKTKMIGSSQVKTDKIDAEVLARLLASGFIPTIWQPTTEIEELRKVTIFADAITSQMIMAKNRIHSILHRNLVPYSKVVKLFNGVGRKFLNGVVLPEDEKFQFDLELKMLDYLEKETKTIRERIARKVMADEDSKRMMTIPGIDFFTALSLKAVIGDIERFKTPKKLVSYMGLNPTVYQSGSSCNMGRITKRGSTHGRWVLVGASKHLASTPGPVRAFFLRVKRRSCRNVAIVAVASKLTRIIWYMLKRKEDYKYAHPLRTKEKFAKLRIVATGVRLSSGRKKTEPLRGGGKKVYLEARAHDHDNAIQGQKEYEEFVESRVGTKPIKATTFSINQVSQKILTAPKVETLVPLEAGKVD